jgi:hypothetical protein
MSQIFLTIHTYLVVPDPGVISMLTFEILRSKWHYQRRLIVTCHVVQIKYYVSVLNTFFELNVI